MLLKPHWTLRYVVGRVGVAIRHKLRPNDPWLTSRAISIINRFLSAEMRGVEFGSGVSTIWLAGRCGHLVSVEHDSKWFDIVSAKLSDAGVDNVDYNLCQTGAEYEAAIDAVSAIDFALIDGKRRAATALKAIDRIRPGGVLILDNADRHVPTGDPDWQPILKLLEAWEYVPTSNGVWRTDFWFRPKDAS